MECEYDQEADALNPRVAPLGPVAAETCEVALGVMIDVDATGG